MARGHRPTRTLRRSPRVRDRIWQSMRVLRRFTLPDLVATTGASRENAKKYVRGLVRAGYLRCLSPYARGRKGGHAVWMLARDTGPHAPRLQADGQTYDPNERRVYPGGIHQ